MGLYKNCYSVNGASVELAELALYDEVEARNVAAPPGNPGFDDLMGEPFLEDNDDDGVGERVRPEEVVQVKCKVDFGSYEVQQQEQHGNEPSGQLTLEVYESDLAARGLLVDGVVKIRPNDRLLRVLNSESGEVRIDLTTSGRPGMFVYEVRPAETGTGKLKIMLEHRRSA